MRSGRSSAFTLIEVLIVVVIMAVMAATIIPQFSSTVNDSKMGSLKFNLHTIRSQLELYKEQHLGKYPPAAGSEDLRNQLTGKTDQTTAMEENGAYGPYLDGDLPVNPFNNSKTVEILTGDNEPTTATGSGHGWQYNPAHGWFYPNNQEYFAR